MRLKEIFIPHHITKGSLFAQKGIIPTQMGFVVSGLFRYYYIDFQGVEVTKHFCSENNFVASYSALLLQEESDLYIEALEDATLLVCNFSAWTDLLESTICWQVIARKILENIFLVIEKRERDLLLEDARSRYVTFLHKYPHLKKRIKQYHIASYLGISPVTLSRIHTKLHLS